MVCLWFSWGTCFDTGQRRHCDPASHLFCKGAQPHVAARCVVKAQRTASVMVVPVQTTGAGASGFGKVWTILTMVSGVYIYNIILLYTKWCVLIIYIYIIYIIYYIYYIYIYIYYILYIYYIYTVYMKYIYIYTLYKYTISVYIYTHIKHTHTLYMYNIYKQLLVFINQLTTGRAPADS